MLNAGEIVDLARAKSWTRKQVKGACYENKIPVEQRDEVYAALGMATKGEAVSAEAAARPAWKDDQAAMLAKKAQAAAADSVIEAAGGGRPHDMEARRRAISDGAVIWCDAGPNTTRRAVNSYGKLVKFDNGGFRAGLLVETEEGDFESRHYNTQCPDQFAGECWAVLKAIELAAERGLSRVVVRNDRIGGFRATEKKGYAGTKYLYVAQKIASENGLEVEFDCCSSAENRADRVVRTD